MNRPHPLATIAQRSRHAPEGRRWDSSTRYRRTTTDSVAVRCDHPTNSLAVVRARDSQHGGSTAAPHLQSPARGQDEGRLGAAPTCKGSALDHSAGEQDPRLAEHPYPPQDRGGMLGPEGEPQPVVVDAGNPPRTCRPAQRVRRSGRLPHARSQGPWTLIRSANTINARTVMTGTWVDRRPQPCWPRLGSRSSREPLANPGADPPASEWSVS